jgi:polysaccharide biosynthesis protein PslE
MRQSLYQVEIQEQELAGKMQDTHPRLAALREQVADLRQILAAQPQQRLQSTEALNPSRQALELSLLNESSQAEALVAREQSLVALQGQLQRQLHDLNTQGIAVEQLQQQVELAETNHKDYAQKLEQSRMSRSLDEERISSLSIVQPASYVAKAIGPRRALVLAVGLACAAMAGLATALVAAWLNPLLTTAEQLTALLDLPVTGVVPNSLVAAA